MGRDLIIIITIIIIIIIAAALEHFFYALSTSCSHACVIVSLPPNAVGTPIITFPPTDKVKLNKVQSSQGPTARKWQSWKSNPVTVAPKLSLIQRP